MSRNVFIGIDYDDAYKAVFIEGPGDFRQEFATGDPPADFQAAIDLGSARASAHGVVFMTLSSLDGFVFDVPGWRFNGDDMLERDPEDYHPDGRVKTRKELDAEMDAILRAQP